MLTVVILEGDPWDFISLLLYVWLASGGDCWVIFILCVLKCGFSLCAKYLGSHVSTAFFKGQRFTVNSNRRRTHIIRGSWRLWDIVNPASTCCGDLEERHLSFPSTTGRKGRRCSISLEEAGSTRGGFCGSQSRILFKYRRLQCNYDEQYLSFQKEQYDMSNS